MRLSFWKQDKKGAHWRRIGVINAQPAGQWPFKVRMGFAEFALGNQWPRYQYHTKEVLQPRLLEVRR